MKFAWNTCSLLKLPSTKLSYDILNLNTSSDFEQFHSMCHRSVEQENRGFFNHCSLKATYCKLHLRISHMAPYLSYYFLCMVPNNFTPPIWRQWRGRECLGTQWIIGPPINLASYTVPWRSRIFFTNFELQIAAT